MNQSCSSDSITSRCRSRERRNAQNYTALRVPTMSPDVVREFQERKRAASGSDTGSGDTVNLEPSKLKSSVWPVTPRAPPSSPVKKDHYGVGAEGMQCPMAPSDVLKATIRRLAEEIIDVKNDMLISAYELKVLALKVARLERRVDQFEDKLNKI